MSNRNKSNSFGGMAMPADCATPSLGDHIAANSVQCRHALQKLLVIAPPPPDFAGVFKVATGGVACLSLAFAALTKPNGNSTAVLSNFDSIGSGCAAVYAALTSGEHSHSLQRQLTAYPTWGLLASLADDDASEGVRFAAGVALAVAWHRSESIRKAHAHGLRRDRLCDLDVQTLMDGHRDAHLRKVFSWVPHFSSLLEEFHAIYDDSPPPRASEKTFAERVDSQIRAAAAHPHPRIRAGVAFKYTLGRQQAEAVITHISNLERCEHDESSAVLWITGFAGVGVETCRSIPILSTMTEDWSIAVDVAAGTLKTNWQCLTSDAARGLGVEGQAAAPVFTIPLPRRTALLLQTRLRACPEAQVLSDLLPSLRALESHQHIVSSLAAMPPTWARWSKTVSVLLREAGMDALVAAILSGDPGAMGRAKLYYARVNSAEIWQAAARAYALFGWSEPVPMPADLLAFGSLVVPTDEAISTRDSDNISVTETMRPGPRCTWIDLVRFHNAFAVAFTFRASLRLALREFAAFPVAATVHKSDRTIDLVEKSSQSRKGALPAVMTEGLRLDLRLWRLHIDAMHNRAQKLAPRSPALQWLQSVVQADSVPLVLLLQANGDVIPASTASVLSAQQDKPLAVDFGRKWTENALRKAGMSTADVDRVMRHDVQGQENYSALSLGGELTWAQRVGDELDRLHAGLFNLPLTGLSKGDL